MSLPVFSMKASVGIFSVTSGFAATHTMKWPLLSGRTTRVPEHGARKSTNVSPDTSHFSCLSTGVRSQTVASCGFFRSDQLP